MVPGRSVRHGDCDSLLQGNEDNLGYSERMRHVGLIWEGAPSHMVMFVAFAYNKPKPKRSRTV